jgi:hypothetical protein
MRTVTFTVTDPAIPTWALNAPLYQWTAVPVTNTLASVTYSPNPGGDGAFQIVDGWGGAAVDPDTSAVYLWGGGHFGYAGNELYKLNLYAAAPSWERVNDPSVPAAQNVRYYADGKPSARHTYQSLWVTGGKIKSIGGAYVWGDSSVSPNEVDVFDLATETWSRTGTVGGEWWTCGDHTSGAVYAVRPRSDLSFTVQYLQLSSGNAWTTLGSGPQWAGASFAGSAFDAGRSRVYRIGSYDANAPVEYFQVGGAAVNPALTGATATNFDNCGGYPGVDYDSQNGWILLRQGNGSTVYRLNCATLVCDTLATTGSVVNPGAGAVCGRFKYVPALKGFVYIPAWGYAYFLRTA